MNPPLSSKRGAVTFAPGKFIPEKHTSRDEVLQLKRSRISMSRYRCQHLYFFNQGLSFYVGKSAWLLSSYSPPLAVTADVVSSRTTSYLAAGAACVFELEKFLAR